MIRRQIRTLLFFAFLLLSGICGSNMPKTARKPTRDLVDLKGLEIFMGKSTTDGLFYLGSWENPLLDPFRTGSFVVCKTGCEIRKTEDIFEIQVPLISSATRPIIFWDFASLFGAAKDIFSYTDTLLGIVYDQKNGQHLSMRFRDHQNIIYVEALIKSFMGVLHPNVLVTSRLIPTNATALHLPEIPKENLWEVKLEDQSLAATKDLFECSQYIDLLKASDGIYEFNIVKIGYIAEKHKALEFKISVSSYLAKFLYKLVPIICAGEMASQLKNILSFGLESIPGTGRTQLYLRFPEGMSPEDILEIRAVLFYAYYWTVGEIVIGVTGKPTKFKRTSFMIEGQDSVKCTSPTQYCQRMLNHINAASTAPAILKFIPRSTDKPVENLTHLRTTFQPGASPISLKFLFTSLYELLVGDEFPKTKNVMLTELRMTFSKNGEISLQLSVANHQKGDVAAVMNLLIMVLRSSDIDAAVTIRFLRNMKPGTIEKPFTGTGETFYELGKEDILIDVHQTSGNVALPESLTQTATKAKKKSRKKNVKAAESSVKVAEPVNPETKEDVISSLSPLEPSTQIVKVQEPTLVNDIPAEILVQKAADGDNGTEIVPESGKEIVEVVVPEVVPESGKEIVEIVVPEVVPESGKEIVEIVVPECVAESDKEIVEIVTVENQPEKLENKSEDAVMEPVVFEPAKNVDLTDLDPIEPLEKVSLPSPVECNFDISEIQGLIVYNGGFVKRGLLGLGFWHNPLYFPIKHVLTSNFFNSIQILFGSKPFGNGSFAVVRSTNGKRIFEKQIHEIQVSIPDIESRTTLFKLTMYLFDGWGGAFADSEQFLGFKYDISAGEYLALRFSTSNIQLDCIKDVYSVYVPNAVVSENVISEESSSEFVPRPGSASGPYWNLNFGTEVVSGHYTLHELLELVFLLQSDTGLMMMDATQDGYKHGSDKAVEYSITMKPDLPLPARSYYLSQVLFKMLPQLFEGRLSEDFKKVISFGVVVGDESVSLYFRFPPESNRKELSSSLRYLFDRTLIDVAMNRGRDCTLFKSGFFEGHRNARCPHPGRFGELITDFMSSHSKKPAILKFDAMPMEAPVKNLVFMRANFKKDANLDASILFLSLHLFFANKEFLPQDAPHLTEIRLTPSVSTKDTYTIQLSFANEKGNLNMMFSTFYLTLRACGIEPNISTKFLNSMARGTKECLYPLEISIDDLKKRDMIMTVKELGIESQPTNIKKDEPSKSTLKPIQKSKAQKKRERKIALQNAPIVHKQASVDLTAEVSEAAVSSSDIEIVETEATVKMEIEKDVHEVSDTVPQKVLAENIKKDEPSQSTLKPVQKSKAQKKRERKLALQNAPIAHKQAAVDLTVEVMEDDVSTSDIKIFEAEAAAETEIGQKVNEVSNTVSQNVPVDEQVAEIVNEIDESQVIKNEAISETIVTAENTEVALPEVVQPEVGFVDPIPVSSVSEATVEEMIELKPEEVRLEIEKDDEPIVPHLSQEDVQDVDEEQVNEPFVIEPLIVEELVNELVANNETNSTEEQETALNEHETVQKNIEFGPILAKVDSSLTQMIVGPVIRTTDAAPESDSEWYSSPRVMVTPKGSAPTFAYDAGTWDLYRDGKGTFWSPFWLHSMALHVIRKKLFTTPRPAKGAHLCSLVVEIPVKCAQTVLGDILEWIETDSSEYVRHRTFSVSLMGARLNALDEESGSFKFVHVVFTLRYPLDTKIDSWIEACKNIIGLEKEQPIIHKFTSEKLMAPTQIFDLVDPVTASEQWEILCNKTVIECGHLFAVSNALKALGPLRVVPSCLVRRKLAQGEQSVMDPSRTVSIQPVPGMQAFNMSYLFFDTLVRMLDTFQTDAELPIHEWLEPLMHHVEAFYFAPIPGTDNSVLNFQLEAGIASNILNWARMVTYRVSGALCQPTHLVPLQDLIPEADLSYLKAPAHVYSLSLESSPISIPDLVRLLRYYITYDSDIAEEFPEVFLVDFEGPSASDEELDLKQITLCQSRFIGLPASHLISFIVEICYLIHWIPVMGIPRKLWIKRVSPEQYIIGLGIDHIEGAESNIRAIIDILMLKTGVSGLVDLNEVPKHDIDSVDGLEKVITSTLVRMDEMERERIAQLDDACSEDLDAMKSENPAQEEIVEEIWPKTVITTIEYQDMLLNVSFVLEGPLEDALPSHFASENLYQTIIEIIGKLPSDYLKAGNRLEISKNGAVMTELAYMKARLPHSENTIDIALKLFEMVLRRGDAPLISLELGPYSDVETVFQLGIKSSSTISNIQNIEYLSADLSSSIRWTLLWHKHP